jgi:hypothetical protein
MLFRKLLMSLCQLIVKDSWPPGFLQNCMYINKTYQAVIFGVLREVRYN